MKHNLAPPIATSEQWWSCP